MAIKTSKKAEKEANSATLHADGLVEKYKQIVLGRKELKSKNKLKK